MTTIPVYPTIPGFEIEQEIGRGGMGIVYLARDVALQRPVAIKVLTSTNQWHAEAIARFREEALILARLHHPGIVQIIQTGEIGNLHYLVMEFIDGKNLESFPKGTFQHPIDAACIILQLAEAVHVAHLAGVVHRDLKPANILIKIEPPSSPQTTQAGNKARQHKVVVTDFGLALRMDDALRLTQPGCIVGTPHYIGPEVGNVDFPMSPRSDIYSIGVILYELLAGQPPFQGSLSMNVLMAAVKKEPVLLRRLVHSVPVDLQTICMKCLEKDPNRRYETAQHLADDLQRFLEGLPVKARPLGLVGKAGRFSKRNPGMVTVLVLFIFFLIGSLVTFVMLYLGAENARQVAQHRLEQSVKNFNYAREAVDQLLIVLNDRLNDTEDVSEAREAMLQSALSFYHQFLQDYPNEPELWEHSADAWHRLGQVHALRGDTKNALAAYDQALGLHHRRAIVETQSANIDLATVLHAKGKLLMGTTQELDALPVLSDAMSYCETARLQRSPQENTRHLAAQIASVQGSILGSQGQPQKCFESFQLAASQLRQLTIDHPDNLSYREDLVRTLAQQAQASRRKLGTAGYEQALLQCLAEAEILRGMNGETTSNALPDCPLSEQPE